ncbi:sensor histidine kinase [Chloroflexota bacterium]
MRTPITNIVLRQHLLRKNPEKQTEHLNIIERETERLKRIVEDLLRLSRLDQDRMPVNFQPIDLNQLTRHFVEDRTLLAEQNNLSLIFVEQSDLPPVMADTGLLGQVLSILLTNAINYTPPGGVVEVRTATQTHLNQQWVGFSVRDNGVGIALDEQEHLFDRFFRGDAGRQSQTPGTGLELAIAKEIIERHNGTIEMESEPSTTPGTVFRVWLPLDQEA